MEDGNVNEEFKDVGETSTHAQYSSDAQAIFQTHIKPPTETKLLSFDPAAFLGKITYELSSSNFITWQMFARGILRSYGLEDWVLTDHTPKIRGIDQMDIDGSEYLKVPNEFNTYYKKTVSKEDLVIDGNVQFIIRSTLGPKSLMDIQNQTLTAYQIWKTLEKIYLGNDITKRNDLIEETNNMKYNPKTSISRFIDKISSNINNLECLGVMITEDEKADLLYRALPDQYRLMGILEQKDWKSTLEYTLTSIERLKTIEERDRRGTGGVHHVFSTESGYGDRHKNNQTVNKNYLNTNNKNTIHNKNKQGINSKKKMKNNNPNIKCFFCHKKGHIERYCELKKEISRNLLKKGENRSNKKKTNEGNAVNEANLAVSHIKKCEGNLDYSDLFTVDYNATFEKFSNTQQCGNVTLNGSDTYSMWTLDSGATSHMTCNKSILSNLIKRKEPITYANGVTTHSSYVGNLHGRIDKSEINVDNILYVPDIKRNLLSIAKLAKKGYMIVFASVDNEVYANIIGSDNKIVCRVKANEQDTFNLFISNQFNTLCNSVISFKNEEDYMTWHRKMGHCNLDNKEHKKCEVCIHTKMKNLPFKPVRNKSKRIFELVHIDLVGPITSSIYNNKYFVTIIDDFSRYGWVLFVPDKSVVFESVRDWYKKIINIFNKKITYLRSDNGTEFTSNAFKNFCNDYGITQQFTVPGNPQQNGRAERLNGTLIQIARSMLMDGQLCRRFWEDAVRTANYIHNRLPHNGNDKNIPFEVLYGRKVDYSNIHVFGCRVVFLDQNNPKFLNNTREGIFLGYDENPTGYRVFDLKNMRTYVRRVVEFLEDQPGNFNYDFNSNDNSTREVEESSTTQNPILQSGNFYSTQNFAHNKENNNEVSKHKEEFELIEKKLNQLEDLLNNKNRLPSSDETSHMSISDNDYDNSDTKVSNMSFESTKSNNCISEKDHYAEIDNCCNESEGISLGCCSN